MMKLRPNETELHGSWRFIDSSMQADDIAKRIEVLISTYLTLIAEDESGWNKLFLDPEDKRYWELTYPESEMHGGGAPLLRNLSAIEAKRKYTL